MRQPPQDPSKPAQEPAQEPAARAARARRWSWIATGLGILCIAWGALFLSGASLEGSGRTFETRPRYDDAKRRTQAALPWALVRCATGLVLLGVGARLRRGSGSADASS